MAFVFAVVLFGALAFRQISDNLEVKRLRLGEDRISFVSAPGIIISCAGLTLSAVVGCYLMFDPISRIYFYALPLILVVQFLQVLLRVYLQRTLVKTRGFVFRSIAIEGNRGVHFASVVRADLYKYTWWVKVTLTVIDERYDHVTFRIFHFSEPALLRILEGWCGCEIRHPEVKNVKTERRTP